MRYLQLRRAASWGMVCWLGTLTLLACTGHQLPTDPRVRPFHFTALISAPMLYFGWVIPRWLAEVRLGFPKPWITTVDVISASCVVVTLWLFATHRYSAIEYVQMGFISLSTAIVATVMLQRGPNPSA